MLGDIDLTLTPTKVDLSLCLPNRTVIAKLNEVYDIKHNIKLGDLNSLSFTIPPYINRNNVQIENPNISKVKDRYYVKLTKGNDIEYYIINKVNPKADDEKDTKVVNCMSSGYELRDKTIRSYTCTSYNCTQVLTDVLADTIWNIGTIDAVFDLKYRSYEFTSTTVLDAVFQIAEKLGAIIIWDTVNREIDFSQPANVGLNAYLSIAPGKYLKDMDIEINPDEMCTRLKCFGAEGMSFQDKNPTGANYIEDFTYFLYPFTRDEETEEVLTHSDYMSDSLCNAILNYNALLDLKTSEFSSLLDLKEAEEANLTTLDNALTDLYDELIIIQDKIDVAQASGESTTSLLAQQSAKQAEITAKQAEIKTSIETIGAIKVTISIDTALTVDIVSGKITLTIDGNSVQITVLDSDTTSTIASKIVSYINNLKNNKFYDLIGTVTATTNIIEILYYSNYAYDDITVTFTDTDSTGVTATIVSGENIGYQSQIISLKEEIAIENNFTSAQIIERNQFIIEKEWTDESYIDAQDLYDDAWTKFEEIREPLINAKIDIVNFLEVVDCQRDWDKIGIGYTVYVKYPRLNVDIECKIIEIEFDYDEYGISLTIANIRNVESDEEKLIKLLYKSVGTSTQMSNERFKWNGIDDVRSEVNDLIDTLQGQIKDNIEINLNNNVSISRRGLIITSVDSPENMLIGQNGVLAISNDYGVSWKHAITANGIVGDRIYGRILCGVDLTIENSGGTFLVNSTGVTIDNMALQILATETGNNGVTITPLDGLMIVRDDGLARGVFNSSYLGLQKYSSGSWENLFYVDSEGNLSANNITATNADVTGIIDCSDLKLNGTSILDITEGLIDGAFLATESVDNTKISDLSADKINAGTITGITIQTAVENNNRIVLTNNSLMTYAQVAIDEVTFSENLNGIAWGSEVVGEDNTYGDVHFYDVGVSTMLFYNNGFGNGWTIKAISPACLGLGGVGTYTDAFGTWRFNNTTNIVSAPSGTPGLRKITISTSDPSGGADGDIWLKYTA